METQRLQYFDTAKLIGMFLIYYGHLIERLFVVGYSAFEPVFSIIYSFHILLFFFISGYFSRVQEQKGTALKKTIVARFSAILFYNILAFGVFEISFALFPGLKQDAWIQAFMFERPTSFKYIFTGQSSNNYNVLMWFIYCLLVVEIISLLIRKKTWKVSSYVIFLSISLLLSFTVSSKYFYHITGGLNQQLNDYACISSAILALPFYLAGVLTRQTGLVLTTRNKSINIIIFIVTFFLFILANSQNFKYLPATFNSIHSIFINNLTTGNYILFAFCSLSGIYLTLCIAKTIPYNRYLDYLGKNTLHLFGIQGVLFLYYPLLAQRMAQCNFTFFQVNIIAIFITVVTFILCLPVVKALEVIYNRMITSVFRMIQFILTRGR